MRGLRNGCLVAGLVYGSWASAWPNDPDKALGDVFQMLPAVAALGMTLYKHDTEGRGQLLPSLVITATLTEAIKRGFNHTSWGERPNGGPYSFPSGHVSWACAGAAFLQTRYGSEYGVPAYAMAAYAAWSRVEHDKHHWRDVIAGCALGYGVNSVFSTPYVRGQVSVGPMLSPGVQGLQLSYSW